MAIKFQEKSGNIEVNTKTIVTLDYTELNDKPIINDVELVGSLSLDDLGIQEKGEYAAAADIPTKTSQLTNDSNYINKHQDISYLATKAEVNNKADKTHSHNELHTHSNKNVLDTITQNDIDKWNTPSGGGDVDLSNYYTKAEIDAMLINGDEVSY